MKAKWSISRMIVGVLCLAAIMGGCVCYPEGDIQSLIWETYGAGDILFVITGDDDLYQIHVTRFEFSENDTEIALSAEDGNAYLLVDDIFKKTRNLCKDTFTPSGPTGTWTSITLVSENEQMVIKNIVAWGELHDILEFVEQYLPPRS